MYFMFSIFLLLVTLNVYDAVFFCFQIQEKYNVAYQSVNNVYRRSKKAWVYNIVIIKV